MNAKNLALLFSRLAPITKDRQIELRTWPGRKYFGGDDVPIVYIRLEESKKKSDKIMKQILPLLPKGVKMEWNRHGNGKGGTAGAGLVYVLYLWWSFDFSY